MTDVAPDVKPPQRVIAVWKGDQSFDVSKPGGVVSRIDGHGVSGQGPVDTMLSALGTCSAMDVVGILQKQRTPVSSLEVEVVGTRENASPRRLKHALLIFRISGAGIEREQALKAITLSVTKYCSVRDSLDPNIPVEWELELK
ncbi:MAG: OsmC family protein [Gemmatimonadaceae bacterium]